MTAPVVNSMSVLARLTSEVMKEKRTAARGTLTPVAGEGHTPASFAASIEPLPDVGAPFPYEHPSENIVAAVRNIRREIATIETALVAVEAAINVPTPAVVEPVKDVKVAEAAADAKAKDPAFADRFNQLKKDAQDKTFAKDDDVDSEGEPDESPTLLAPAGWRCPTHGKATTKTSARTGKSYTGCPDCNLFER